MTGGYSAGAATMPIRVAAHGAPSVHAFSARYALGSGDKP